jgi:tetratricopeptide (TPR) repeat protein
MIFIFRRRRSGGGGAALALSVLLALGAVGPLRAADPPLVPSAIIVEKNGRVEVARSGAMVWDLAQTNQALYADDQLRTDEGARAVLRMSDQTLVHVGEFSQIKMPSDPNKRSSLSFIKGIFYFFHRDKPGDYDLRTRTVSAIVRGTEFTIEVVEADGTTTISMFDGVVEMTNDFGGILLKNGQQGLAEPGKAPVITPLLTVKEPRLVQWSLHYPGILYLPDAGLTANETNTLARSIAAYLSGDLVAAYTNWPADHQPGSDAVILYRAATRLAVGQVAKAEAALQGLSATRTQASPAVASQAEDRARVAAALERVIDVVRVRGATSDPSPPVNEGSPENYSRPQSPTLATEWLAESIAQQKRLNLEASLSAARRSVEKAPDFAFGWARVAELEFSFGRIGDALEALDQSLDLAPRNAQALALKGFLLAAQNRVSTALSFFDQAIALDGHLDNAWLGRGLCHIRQGHAGKGREDLQTAVTLNPERALLRSYLGKAYSHEGDQDKGVYELIRAISLDPDDPTAWLYSALLKQQQSRVNEAIRDLERAKALNDSRSRGIVRSRLLLDQDRAVGGANLASVYLDAGLREVSVREAVTAVNADYTSFRSHLLLANSYNALRDPYQINLRYETPWLSEYLVSTLLAPVGAGILSPYVTQQEYSKLFERDGLGLASGTEYRSNGDWYQAAAQYGTFGNTSYALDATYQSLNGYRPNQDIEQLTLSARIKQQLTPADSVFLQGIYYDAESGDVTQYYRQSSAHKSLRVKETQEPILIGGYHHQWSERSHTLALGGHFQDTVQVKDPEQAVLALLRGSAGGPMVAVPSPSLPIAPLNYKSELEGYTTELQQIWKQGDHTLIVGGRFQAGTFDTRSALQMTSPSFFANSAVTSVVQVITPGVTNRVEEDFQRYSVYGYHHWQLADPLLLTAGVSYDRVEYPLDFRNVPVASGQEDRDQVSPKAGLTWSPLRNTTVRAAYTRSLGGVSFDQSFRLEPSQVAGFNQAYRSVIPESVAGSIAASRFETWGVALDQKFGSGTYFGLVAERLASEDARQLGTVDVVGFPPVFTSSSTRQRLDYEERSLLATVNQLVGENWAFGARYRLTDAELETDLTQIPNSVSRFARDTVEATLHQVDLYALFRHHAGFFAQLDSIWISQSNRGYAPDLPGDDFWQFNATTGWSFFQRRLEVKTGLLNFTDRGYRLNPLNLTTEYPRERTWFASLKFYF